MDSVSDLTANNVLLAAPSAGDREREVCGELLAAPDPDTLVGVTTAKTPDRWLSSHLHRTAATPDEVRLVCVGEHSRSATTDATESAPISTSTVSDPGNLTAIGTLLSEHLAGVSSTDAVLCLDSVSTLLHHSERQTVFQFLHVLTDLVSTNGVEAHYHLDPTAHDDQAVASVKVLVDAVITVSGDTVEVETR